MFQTPTVYFKAMLLKQILKKISITFFYNSRFKSSNFIYFTTITKQVIQLILIMLIGTLFVYGWSSCWRNPECPEETHLSDLVTTWPSHMPTPGIEPGSQRWEVSALTLRQPDSHPHFKQNYNWFSLTKHPQNHQIVAIVLVSLSKEFDLSRWDRE